MLASQIITDVRRELLETSAGFWSDEELLRSLNRAEMDFINRTRLLEDQAFLTTTDDVLDYPLPDNWMSAKLVLVNAKREEDDQDSWQRVNPTSLEKMAQESPNFKTIDDSDYRTPYKYWIWNNRLHLYPIPKDLTASNLWLYYKAKPVPLTATSQSIHIDDSLSEALNAYILWKAWTKAKETALAEEQKQIYANYVGEGRRWANRRIGDQRNKMDIISNVPFSEGRPFDSFQF